MTVVKHVVKQDERWPLAHVKLRELYESRVTLSQQEFGGRYAIGSQGMVWQYLNGYTPLNIEAAAKFAKGIRCTIRDISPEMADYLEEDLVPILGKRLRRAAMVLLSLALAGISSAPREAQAAHSFVRSAAGVCIMLNQFWRNLVELAMNSAFFATKQRLSKELSMR